MGEETVDRRVRKTKKQLRECLTRLLKEKKVQDITVRELTDMADLNRGTFYLHYRDVFDLLEKTENELLDEFNSLMYRHNAQDLTNNLPRYLWISSTWSRTTPTWYIFCWERTAT